MPTWFKIVFVFAFIAGMSSMVYAFKTCGAKALAYGNGMFYAAALGVCEE